MLDKKIVFNMIEALCVNFSIVKDKEQIKAYCIIIYPLLEEEKVTDAEFITACKNFMKKTTGNNFKALPGVGDFLDEIGKTPKSIEDMAREEAVNAFNASTGLITKFEHPVTNYVIKFCCGGLDNFIQEYVCKYKENKTAVPFRKNDFIKDWIAAYDNQNYYHENLSCAGYLADAKPVLISSTQKVETMMIKDNRKPENKQAKILIGDLAKNMKG